MSSESRYSDIPRDQIPVDLMMDLPSYSVTLVGLRNENAPLHCGVGTLVRFEEHHFILTAAHCAEPLAKCDQIGLPLGRRYYLKLPVVHPIYVGKRASDEWGPDLAFLPVPPVEARNMMDVSNRRFYNLERHAREMLRGEPQIENGLWAIVGTPTFTSNLEDPNKLEFTKMTYSVGVEPPVMRGEFDYIEARADLRMDNVPPNFKGVSGGGLWHAEVARLADGSLALIGEPKLEGCAFYETRPRGEYVYIRCHGRHSIYEHALGLIRKR